MKTPQPWNRRKDESPNDFAYFVCYRNLGPQRSLERLISLDGIEPTSVYTLAPERMPGLAEMEALADRHAWSERADAWDRHLKALCQDPAPDPTDKRGQRRLEGAEANYEIGELLRRKLMEILAFPATDTILSEVDHGDDTVTKRIISASIWSDKDLAMLAKASTVNLESAASIMPWPTAEGASKEG